jgi:hypothetical protein
MSYFLFKVEISDDNIITLSSILTDNNYMLKVHV